MVAGIAAAAVIVVPRLDDPSPTATKSPAVSVGTPTPTPTPVEVQFTNVAQILHAAGTSAGAQDVDVATAKYWRVESEYQQGGDPVEHRTFWQGHTSAGYLLDTGIGDQLIKMSQAKFDFQQRSLTWDQLLGLTTSRSELLGMLRAGTGELSGAVPDHYAFKTLGELLAETPAPPALRKAMWDAAAELKGVKNDGKMTDHQGRTGYGISLDNMTYIVDPGTGQILESRLVTKGAPSYRITYLSQTPTNVAPTSTTTS
jgi:hypothetical protein